MWPSKSDIEAMYREYGPVLLLFARSICGERSRAEDAVHQVFVKIMDGKALRGIERPKSYLFACVRNELLNQSKPLQRMTTLQDDLWFDPPNKDFAAEAKLRSALNELPEEQRTVVVLHVWGDLAFAEIGKVLGANVNTVASRYRYALGKLRDVMCGKEIPNGNTR